MATVTNHNPPSAGSITDEMLASPILKNLAVAAVNSLRWADRFHDGDTFVVAGKSVTIDATGHGGDVADIVVDTSGSSTLAGDLILVTAGIQALSACPVNAYAKPTGAEAALFFVAKTAGATGNALTLTIVIDGGSHGTVGSTTFTGGQDAAVKQQVRMSHTVTAAEQLTQSVYLRFPFVAGSPPLISYRAATGVVVLDYVADYTTADVLLAPGVTAFVAGDVLVIDVED